MLTEFKSTITNTLSKASVTTTSLNIVKISLICSRKSTIFSYFTSTGEERSQPLDILIVMRHWKLWQHSPPKCWQASLHCHIKLSSNKNYKHTYLLHDYGYVCKIPKISQSTHHTHTHTVLSVSVCVIQPRLPCLVSQRLRNQKIPATSKVLTKLGEQLYREISIDYCSN